MATAVLGLVKQVAASSRNPLRQLEKKPVGESRVLSRAMEENCGPKRDLYELFHLYFSRDA